MVMQKVQEAFLRAISARAWAGEVRLTSGKYAHQQQLLRRPRRNFGVPMDPCVTPKGQIYKNVCNSSLCHGTAQTYTVSLLFCSERHAGNIQCCVDCVDTLPVLCMIWGKQRWQGDASQYDRSGSFYALFKTVELQLTKFICRVLAPFISAYISATV